jgi:serine/threonine protein kinase
MDAVKHQKRFNRHFNRLVTKGRIPQTLNYMISTLCDYNLDELRTIVLEGCDFSKPNAARLCMQAFQAVHDLHSLGYIHRDLSPKKFVLGLENPHLIYLIGMCFLFRIFNAGFV